MRTLKYISTWFLAIILLTGAGTGLYFLYDSGYSLALVLLLGFYSTNLVMSILVFVQRRQMSGKLAWMMMFLLLPFIGHIVFAVFGQRYKYRKNLSEFQQREMFKYEELKKEVGSSLEASMLNKQSSISKRGIYKADIEMISTGDEGYRRLFEDLESAKEFIHLQYYIIKPGEIFDHLKDILIRKASEGVEVRFIVDDFGRWAVPWHVIKELKKSGVRIERFGKVYFPFIGSYNGYRMHRKAAIIDGKIVHTGGINIADEYANLNKKYGLWMDYQIRIVGKAVRSYTLLFIEDWHHVTREKLDFNKYLKETNVGKSKFVMIDDSPEVTVPIIQNSIVNMIYNAKEEIILTTPYLVPTIELFNAIRTASLNGVKVKILIPGKPDKKTVIIATRYYARLFMKYGVEIYQTNSLLIHSKIGVFDGKYSYVGTANLDIRSLYAQWEVIQLLTGPIVKDIKASVEEYIKYSTRLSNDDLKVSKLKDKIIRTYVNLFSPIM